jgi:signal transduction histidine kinase
MMRRGFAEDRLRISLVSSDRRLLELCHEAVRELNLGSYDITLIDPYQADLLRSDLLIWDTDYVNNSRGGLRCATGAQELFLVSRKRLHEFLTKMPLGPGSTLLKPLNNKTLQIFLEQFLLRFRSGNSPSHSDLSPRETDDALQCLLMANLKLQEYDQDRTNFLARAVHDVRAPLMAANGYCSILLQQTVGPLTDSQIELVKRMHRSLKKLTRMTSAMFQLNVGKAVARDLNLKESSLETCVKAALQELEHLVRDKNLKVSINLRGSKDPLYFDQEQLEQVMVNLLDNACRFTQKGGTIEVCGYPIELNEGEKEFERGGAATSSSSRQAYRVDISDTGTGILSQHLESVFEEYTSYGGPEDRSGGGLGLAICKMILTSHGGQIWAENYPAGAKLCFVLPTGNPHARRRIVANNELRLVAHEAVS